MTARLVSRGELPALIARSIGTVYRWEREGLISAAGVDPRGRALFDLDAAAAVAHQRAAHHAEYRQRFNERRWAGHVRDEVAIRERRNTWLAGRRDEHRRRREHARQLEEIRCYARARMEAWRAAQDAQRMRRRERDRRRRQLAALVPQYCAGRSMGWTSPQLMAALELTYGELAIVRRLAAEHRGAG